MERRRMTKLTEEIIKNARPREKPYKLTDSKGLYLFVAKSGSKIWRMRYRFNGLESTYVFGDSSLFTLESIREAAKEIHLLIKRDINPTTFKKGNLKNVKITSNNSAAPISATPVKLLRMHVEHLESQRAHIENKKREVEQQLDYICWDLNEILGFIDQTNMAIRYLESATSEVNK